MTKTYHIKYHYRKSEKHDITGALYAEVGAESASKALEIFYRTHEDPEEIVVTSCLANKTK